MTMKSHLAKPLRVLPTHLQDRLLPSSPSKTRATRGPSLLGPSSSDSPSSSSPGWIAKAALLLIVVQNAALVTCMRFTRMPGHEPYLASTAVAMQELLKLLVCIGLVCWYQPRPLNYLHSQILSEWRMTIKVGVPAFLYTIQNNLTYIALTELDAPIFQVSYQFKILTTAFFTVVILRRTINRQQWFALAALALGVATVQFAQATQWRPTARPDGTISGGSEALNADWTSRVSVKGLGAVACCCVLSGFAGVWFEKMLKAEKKNNNNGSTQQQQQQQQQQQREELQLKHPYKTHAAGSSPPPPFPGSASVDTSLWLRNIQLGGFGLLFSLVKVYYADGAAIEANGFFQGYSPLVCLTIFLGGAGGLIVAVTIKYADNILKGFATSIAVVLSTAVSLLIPAFRFHISGLLAFGSVIVLAAAYWYGRSAGKKQKATPPQPRAQPQPQQHKLITAPGPSNPRSAAAATAAGAGYFAHLAEVEEGRVGALPAAAVAKHSV